MSRIPRNLCCQNRHVGKVCGFKRCVHMVSAYLTGGVIYMIYGWVSKVLKPGDKDPLRLCELKPKARRLGQAPGWGTPEKADIKPRELRNPMLYQTHGAFKKPRYISIKMTLI